MCLDEITNEMEKMNYVIYNPNVDDKPTRIKLLHKTIKAGTGVELTKKQLEHLTGYESNQLHEFIVELQKIINV